MTDGRPQRGMLVARKGDARPPPEPAIRRRPETAGRRVGATLPIDTYVAFKAYVAQRGVTGERAIVSAIEHLLKSS